MEFTVKFSPIGKRVMENRPRLLLDIARKAGVDLKSLCGGKSKCGKCKVMVNPANEATAIEKKLFTPDEIEEGYRLACRTTVREDTRVYVPPSSITEQQKLQIWGKEIEVKPFPSVRKFFLQLTKASLSDTRSDFQRIKEELKRKYNVKVENADSEVLNIIGPTLRDSHWSITAGVRGNEIIGVEPGKRAKESLGIAIDGIFQPAPLNKGMC